MHIQSQSCNNTFVGKAASKMWLKEQWAGLHTKAKTAREVLASLELLILNHERRPTKDLRIFYKVELWKWFFLRSSLETWKGQITNLKEVTMNNFQIFTSVWHKHLASSLIVSLSCNNAKSPVNTYWLSLNCNRDLHWFLYHVVPSE